MSNNSSYINSSIHQYMSNLRCPTLRDVQIEMSNHLRCQTLRCPTIQDVQQFKQFKSNNSNKSTFVNEWNTQKYQLIIYSKYFVPGYDWQKSTWIHCQIKDYGISLNMAQKQNYWSHFESKLIWIWICLNKLDLCDTPS